MNSERIDCIDTDDIEGRRCGACGKKIAGRILVIGKGKQMVDSTGRWRGLSFFCEACAFKGQDFDE